MTTKLIQKQFLKGTREFEIVNGAVSVRIKRPFKEEKLTVGLSLLNPEPVVNESWLEFYGQDGSEPLLSLYLNNPDAERFTAFVEALKQRVREENGAFAGAETTSQPAAPPGNVYEEPPEFKEWGQSRSRKEGKPVDAAKLGNAIEMLERYLAAEDIKPFLAALEALKAAPQDERCFEQMEHAFNDLGIMQGAVLTYAPYISILLADDPLGDH